MAYSYYFQVDTLYIMPGFGTVLVNGYGYTLRAAPVEKDGHILIPVEDFRKIYAQVYDTEIQGETVLVKSYIRQACVPLERWEGTEMLAADLALVYGFDYRRLEKTTAENNRIVMLTRDPEPEQVPLLPSKYLDHLARGKQEGEILELFWFEEGGKQVPYHLFVPSSYDPSQKYPVIFYLHGGRGTPGSGFAHSGGRLQYLAEKHGFLVCGVDGFIQDATYGYILPPNPGDPNLDPDCPENPGHYSEERIAGHKLGEKCLEATIRTIQERYGADPERMFLMGNSMGGEGCFWFAATHPGMFRAINPAGAMIHTRFVDLAPLKDLPILFVGGTEDLHGFDYLRDGVKAMEEYGLDIRHIFVGGGTHSNAWVTVLDEIFDFFLQYC